MRRLCLLPPALLLMLGSHGSHAALELTTEERAFIARNPTIIVGGMTNRPPLETLENGEYAGAARDFIEQVAELTGLEVEFSIGPAWADQMARLQRGEIDVLPIMYATKDRRLTLNLTDAYMTFRRYVFTDPSRTEASSMADLSGLRVSVTQGYAQAEQLKRAYPDIDIVYSASLLDSVDKVVTQRADAIIGNTSVLGSLLQREGITSLAPAFPVPSDENRIVMGVRKDWPVLRDIISKALTEIGIEGTANTLTKWSGSRAAAMTLVNDSAELSAAEREHFAARREIAACIHSNMMPIEGARNFSHTGVTSDFMAILSEKLGVRVTPVPGTSWQELRTKLIAGRCDILPFASSTIGSAEDLSISSEYLTESLALITKSDQPFLESLDELSDTSVIVIDGLIDMQTLQKRFRTIRFESVETRRDAYEQVASGDHYGLIDMVPVANRQIRKARKDPLSVSALIPDLLVSAGMATRPGDTILAVAVEKVLAAVSISQQQNIHLKWNSTGGETGISYQMLIQLLVAFSIVLIFTLFRLAEVRGHQSQIKVKNDELEETNRKLEAQRQSAVHLAYHDKLTGLANRAKLKVDLERKLHNCDRFDQHVALLFLDLDRFKLVNDSLGHDIGDKLLIAVGRRISRLLRESDLLCRVGGDEFIIVLEAVSDDYSPCKVAARVIDALTKPFDIDGNAIHIGTSVGIALYPGDATEQEQLIKCADNAMYAAKEDGRNSYRYFSDELTATTERRMLIESSLRNSPQYQEFRLELQPIIDMHARRVTKAEALIRWDHPEAGPISPDEFIPIAEEYGIVTEITDWVIREACMILHRLDSQDVAIDALTVNVSTVDFLRGDITDRCAAAIRESGSAAERIEIEITERNMLDRSESVEADLNTLRQQGHRISVDDFGTGYSSLGYMKRLPLNAIKIDRSFTYNLPNEPDNVEITQAIVSLSHALGYATVAEGVETEEQLAFLMRIGCDFAQGFYFSKPISESRFPEVVARINRELHAMSPPTAVVSHLRS